MWQLFLLFFVCADNPTLLLRRQITQVPPANSPVPPAVIPAPVADNPAPPADSPAPPAVIPTPMADNPSPPVTFFRYYCFKPCLQLNLYKIGFSQRRGPVRY